MGHKNKNPFNDTGATIRLKDPASGGTVELRLELDPKREVVVDAKYRLIDLPDEERAAEIISKLIRGKGVLFSMTLAEKDLTGKGVGRSETPLSLVALKLALLEYIMRRYAVETGIVKDGEEFIEEFLKGHPMYGMFSDVDLDRGD